MEIASGGDDVKLRGQKEGSANW